MANVIIIKEGGGAVYTRAGENEEDIMCKAFFFMKTWPQFETAEYDSSKVECPDVIDNEVAWQKIVELYNNKDRVNIIRRMMASPHIQDILHCKEDEVREFLLDELFRSKTKNFTKKASINNMCSNLRGMFRSIGREHSAEHGKVYKFFHKDLVNSANPMTTATERLLEVKLETLMKANNGTSIRQATDKHSAPISVVGAYALLLMHLDRALHRMKDLVSNQIKQTERVENMLNLFLINAFELHEGSRPIELQKHMYHKDLFLPLHQRVYWLTLAFLSPPTLNYLLVNNKIPYYVYGLFKGKGEQSRLYRMKGVIPCAFNSVDIVTLYTITMKCMLCILPEQLDEYVFKRDLNITSLRARLDKHSLFANFTHYSYRYGAAKEEKAAKINPDWTRQRMGHSVKSNMKDRYANTKELRVTCGGEDIPLGMDIYDTPTNPKVITLEMNLISNGGVSYDTKWLDNCFDGHHEMKLEFEQVNMLVTRFLEEDDDAAKETLLEMFETSHPRKELDRWLGQFPLGTHINIPTSMTTPALRDLMQKHTESLNELLEPVDKPRITPELWSFPQVMYGNWRKLLEIPDTLAPKDLIVKPKPQERQEPPAKKPRIEEEPPEIAEANCIEDIEPNDHIVILCRDTRDPCRLKLPHIDEFVWVARATAHVTKKGKFSGVFYTNKEHDISKPLHVRNGNIETMTITDDSLVKIYAADDEEFSLTAENIQEIEDIWQS